jgi:6-phosphogluconolactonase
MKVARRWLLGFAALACSLTAQGRQFHVYFGTYTGGASRGIYVARLDAANGRLSPAELAAETASPSYLAVSPGEQFLYAANEADHLKDYPRADAGAVSAFAVTKTSGQLTLLNQVFSGGSSPCYVSVDDTGKVLLAANYGDGTVRAFRLEENGAIGAAGDSIARVGHSVNPARQTSPHAHFICADPSDRFAIACDLGTDEVIVFSLDPQAAGLHPAKSASFKVPAGSGPRHLAFSPDGKFAHVINEMACTITTFAWDAQTGELKLVETVPVLPADVTVQPGFTAAEILAAGNHVYATIRGHDSVSAFVADPRSGRLGFLQNIPSGGKVPRGMGLDPTGHWLLVGNQGSDKVVEFSINAGSGGLSATGEELKIGSPVDIKFIKNQ